MGRDAYQTFRKIFWEAVSPTSWLYSSLPQQISNSGGCWSPHYVFSWRSTVSWRKWNSGERSIEGRNTHLGEDIVLFGSPRGNSHLCQFNYKAEENKVQETGINLQNDQILTVVVKNVSCHCLECQTPCKELHKHIINLWLMSKTFCKHYMEMELK